MNGRSVPSLLAGFVARREILAALITRPRQVRQRLARLRQLHSGIEGRGLGHGMSPLGCCTPRGYVCGYE